MHPRVESLPRPKPDYREFLATVRRQDAKRVPLIELAVDPEMVAELAEEPLGQVPASPETQQHLTRHAVRLHHRLGYDVVKVAATIPFGIKRLHADDTAELSRGTRQWQDERGGGVILNLAQCERFAWPGSSDVDYGPVETALQILPEGMAGIGFCGGVLEFAMDLIGLERFMYAVYDQADLIAAVTERVGRTLQAVFEVYCQMESVCGLWLGDDLGSKNGLLISPDVLTAHVFPWYKRYADMAHRHGRPFLLHSCGNIAAVMPTLVEQVGIDAKHSFEDAIQPVELFADEWAARVAVLGGIDVNLLSTGSEESVAARTRQVLECAAPAGGYACGSGNSITNYVRPGNYLTMIETVAAFNGRI
jgi:uroporphyrinogen decarboxylase